MALFTSEKSSSKKLGKNVVNSHDDLIIQFLELEIISQYVRRSLSVFQGISFHRFIDFPILYQSRFMLFFASPLLSLVSRKPGQEIDYFLFHERE